MSLATPLATARAELEADVLARIERFEEQTGLRVTGIALRPDFVPENGGMRNVRVIRADVMLPPPEGANP